MNRVRRTKNLLTTIEAVKEGRDISATGSLILIELILRDAEVLARETLAQVARRQELRQRGRFLVRRPDVLRRPSYGRAGARGNRA